MPRQSRPIDHLQMADRTHQITTVMVRLCSSFKLMPRQSRPIDHLQMADRTHQRTTVMVRPCFGFKLMPRQSRPIDHLQMTGKTHQSTTVMVRPCSSFKLMPRQSRPIDHLQMADRTTTQEIYTHNKHIFLWPKTISRTQNRLSRLHSVKGTSHCQQTAEAGQRMPTRMPDNKPASTRLSSNQPCC